MESCIWHLGPRHGDGSGHDACLGWWMPASPPALVVSDACSLMWEGSHEELNVEKSGPTLQTESMVSLDARKHQADSGFSSRRAGLSLSLLPWSMPTAASWAVRACGSEPGTSGSCRLLQTCRHLAGPDPHVLKAVCNDRKPADAADQQGV